MAVILVRGLGLETVMRVDRPAMPGDVLRVKVASVDVANGTFQLADASLPSWPQPENSKDDRLEGEDDADGQTAVAIDDELPDRTAV